MSIDELDLIPTLFPLVRVEGLEPPRRKTPEPKSGASTNSATPALGKEGEVR